jgi:hypothetical protein
VIPHHLGVYFGGRSHRLAPARWLQHEIHDPLPRYYACHSFCHHSALERWRGGLSFKCCLTQQKLKQVVTTHAKANIKAEAMAWFWQEFLATVRESLGKQWDHPVSLLGRGPVTLGKGKFACRCR